VVDAGLKVHAALGPGLLESAYEHCLAFEMERRGHVVRRQIALPIVYEGAKLDAGYRIDLLVGDLVIVEVKAVEVLAPIHQAQLLTYLKLTQRARSRSAASALLAQTARVGILRPSCALCLCGEKNALLTTATEVATALGGRNAPPLGPLAADLRGVGVALPRACALSGAIGGIRAGRRMDNAFSLDRARVADLLAAERERYRARCPRSAALAAAARAHMLDGVPMHWMTDWATPFPLFVERAQGARFTDADGHDYADFCLGDTGAMFGHAPAPVLDAIARVGGRGFTHMLPTEDAIAVSGLLAERFGLPVWQFAATATDANRFVLRWARGITGRKAVLVFDGCYHGTADDTFVTLADGRPAMKPGLIGQAYDLLEHSRVVPFNDLAAVEAALAPGDVACVLTEPALTNCGMVLPAPGFHEGLRALTRRHGTLLVIDETHTISSGPGGHTRAYGLEPDILTLGKPIAGGIPAAAYGFTTEVADRIRALRAATPPGHSGIGTTLAAGAAAMAAMRAMLEEVITPKVYRGIEALAARLAAGLSGTIDRYGLPWCVTRLGARAEFQFRPTPPANAAEAAASFDEDLETLMRLFLINRGVLITPFHNMVLVGAATGDAEVDALLAGFDAAAAALAGR
jgi:glutamate-1-semialdehyde 2,1-aminomutase